MGEGGPKSIPPAAFTLIEVLVVVGMIALLLSILLPSLSQAKQQARTVACGSHLSQIGRAENTYRTQDREWIVGSPWTTGYPAMMSDIDSADWPSFAQSDRLIVDWFDHSTPLRALIQGGRSIPYDRNQMLVQFTQGLFQCDSNPHTAVPYPASHPGPTIQAISYLSMWSIMRAGDSGYHEAAHMPFIGAGANAGHVGQDQDWEMSVPAGYYPRHGKLGRDSLKVFMADGFRFYDDATQVMDYDAEGFRCAKGIGNVDEPPSTAGGNYNQMYNKARRYAYRHGSNNAINAVFFDGHVAMLRVNYHGGPTQYSGYTGEAVHPKYYYPTGTVINEANYLHLPIPVGTRLP